MKFEHTSVSNFEGSLTGMRNPLASWARSDSVFDICKYDDMQDYEVAKLWVNKLYPDLDKDSNEYFEKEDTIASWLRNEGIIKNSEDYSYIEYAFIGRGFDGEGVPDPS